MFVDRVNPNHQSARRDNLTHSGNIVDGMTAYQRIKVTLALMLAQHFKVDEDPVGAGVNGELC
jgi:hypothetical protein